MTRFTRTVGVAGALPAGSFAFDAGCSCGTRCAHRLADRTGQRRQFGCGGTQMSTNARFLRILLAGFLATPLLAQSKPITEELEGKNIEQILVQGLRKVPEATVLRQMKSKVGEPHSASNEAKDRERLDRMAVFSKIAIDARPGTHGVILREDLKETLSYLPYPAIGVTGEQGVTFGLGLKSTNFLSSGANLAAAARFGGANEIECLANSPWRPYTSWWWKAEFFLRDRTNKLDNFEEFANELDLQAGRQVTDRLRIGGLFHYVSIKSDTSGITLSPTNKDIVPGLGVVAEFDTRDSWTDPKRGWLNSVDAAANGLGTEANYSTFNFDIRRYQPIAGRHGVALFSLLTLQTGDNGIDIPAWADFHIGGTNSLRGWKINARRGNNQWLNTFEYRYDLFKRRDISVKGLNFYAGVQLALFTDIGSAWNESEEFSRNFIGGAGFGIRLIVPYVNLVRIDFGFGQSGQGVIPHFGVLEKAVYQRRRVR